jgi:5'-nucleotidase / UDP-sugar diphosphatase
MDRRLVLQGMAAGVALAFIPSAVRAVVATFSDVPSTHTHAQGIQWAVDRGVVKGYPDGTFRPDSPVTRGQLASMLAKLDA